MNQDMQSGNSSVTLGTGAKGMVKLYFPPDSTEEEKLNIIKEAVILYKGLHATMLLHGVSI